jgi:hypothetical protein
MSDNLPMERPLCPTSAEHGRTALRVNPDKLAAWCGTWYDCPAPGCHSSVLFESPELAAQHRALAAGARS